MKNINTLLFQFFVQSLILALMFVGMIDASKSSEKYETTLPEQLIPYTTYFGAQESFNNPTLDDFINETNSSKDTYKSIEMIKNDFDNFNNSSTLAFPKTDLDENAVWSEDTCQCMVALLRLYHELVKKYADPNKLPKNFVETDGLIDKLFIISFIEKLAEKNIETLIELIRLGNFIGIPTIIRHAIAECLCRELAKPENSAFINDASYQFDEFLTNHEQFFEGFCSILSFSWDTSEANENYHWVSPLFKNNMSKRGNFIVETGKTSEVIHITKALMNPPQKIVLSVPQGEIPEHITFLTERIIAYTTQVDKRIHLIDVVSGIELEVISPVLGSVFKDDIRRRTDFTGACINISDKTAVIIKMEQTPLLKTIITKTLEYALKDRKSLTINQDSWAYNLLPPSHQTDVSTFFYNKNRLAQEQFWGLLKDCCSSANLGERYNLSKMLHAYGISFGFIAPDKQSLFESLEDLCQNDTKRRLNTNCTSINNKIMYTEGVKIF